MANISDSGDDNLFRVLTGPKKVVDYFCSKLNELSALSGQGTSESENESSLQGESPSEVSNLSSDQSSIEVSGSECSHQSGVTTNSTMTLNPPNSPNDLNSSFDDEKSRDSTTEEDKREDPFHEKIIENENDAILNIAEEKASVSINLPGPSTMIGGSKLKGTAKLKKGDRRSYFVHRLHGFRLHRGQKQVLVEWDSSEKIEQLVWLPISLLDEDLYKGWMVDIVQLMFCKTYVEPIEFMREIVQVDIESTPNIRMLTRLEITEGENSFIAEEWTDYENFSLGEKRKVIECKDYQKKLSPVYTQVAAEILQEEHTLRLRQRVLEECQVERDSDLSYYPETSYEPSSVTDLDSDFCP